MLASMLKLLRALVLIEMALLPAQMSGGITYNGHQLNEFVVERTSGYVDQQDTHLAELTVRETFNFSARCQGSGSKAGAHVRFPAAIVAPWPFKMKKSILGTAGPTLSPGDRQHTAFCRSCDGCSAVFGHCR